MSILYDNIIRMITSTTILLIRLINLPFNIRKIPDLASYTEGWPFFMQHAYFIF